MSTLNITNGDHAGEKLKTILDGPVITAADVLHEGPCPAVDGDAWHAVRARFLSDGGYASYQDVKQGLGATDRRIAEACAREEAMVLWFEHDLFDQLELIRTLDLIGRVLSDPAGDGSTGPAPRQHHASLICIGAFPGVDRFVGLGQLAPDQLATLKGTGSPLTVGHYGLAIDAWRAFRSPDPRQLLAIPESPFLPFLHAALRRFLAEYPSTENGLSRTEKLALEALLDGPATGGALFAASQAHEARPFMGDSTFFDILAGLASARVPLITIDGDGAADRRQRFAITDAGRDVLAGRADHVRLNGIDIWRGGVHLTGSDISPWRWDIERETLVS